MGEAGFRLLQAHGVNGLQEEPIHESASCPGWLYFWLPGIFKNPFPLTFPPKARPIAVQTLCSPSSGTWAESSVLGSEFFTAHISCSHPLQRVYM